MACTETIAEPVPTDGATDQRCTKIPYDTRREARVAANLLRYRRKRKDLHCYRCGYCGCWHLTRRKAQ